MLFFKNQIFAWVLLFFILFWWWGWGWGCPAAEPPSDEHYAGKRLVNGKWFCQSNRDCLRFADGNICRDGFCWTI